MGRPVGYSALIARHSIPCVPLLRVAEISGASRHVTTKVGHEIENFPTAYHPGERDTDHLLFALRYESLSLEVLRRALPHVDAKEITAGIFDKPTSKYVRRLWFLYEWLLNTALDVPDLTGRQGSYVPVCEPDKYFVHPGVRVRRQRVFNNLLGTRDWCPIVRKTQTLQDNRKKQLDRKAASQIDNVDPAILMRAVSFLYTKETRSSFLIERERPGQEREERFHTLLREAGRISSLEKSTLLDLQNAIVDERFTATNYRDDNVYVGESISLVRERVHYVAPRSQDVPEMMQALLDFSARHVQTGQSLDPVVVAACLSFGFVFIHPFEDGNGRLHRFLIHYVLARTGFTPPAIILPVSASILKDQAGYDTTLEAFSARVNRCVQYKLDSTTGKISIENETADLYRYPDMTAQAEALYGWIETAIERDLLDEINIIERFDRASASLQAIVDLPDRLLHLFLRCTFHNAGNGYRLARKKRRLFAMLSDSELIAMEEAVAEAFSSETWSSRASNEPPARTFGSKETGLTEFDFSRPRVLMDNLKAEPKDR